MSHLHAVSVLMVLDAEAGRTFNLMDAPCRHHARFFFPGSDVLMRR